MFGSFWRARRLWSSAAAEVESSSDGDSTTRRPGRGGSPSVDFSPLGDEIAFRPEPRTPGPGAAWSGGRL